MPILTGERVVSVNGSPIQGSLWMSLPRFSEDHAVNNRPNISILAKLMTKRLKADDLHLVAQCKAKNTVTPSAEIDGVPGSTEETTGEGTTTVTEVEEKLNAV
jgi:hypothetical protein